MRLTVIDRVFSALVEKTLEMMSVIRRTHFTATPARTQIFRTTVRSAEDHSQQCATAAEKFGHSR